MLTLYTTEKDGKRICMKRSRRDEIVGDSPGKLLSAMTPENRLAPGQLIRELFDVEYNSKRIHVLIEVPRQWRRQNEKVEAAKTMPLNRQLKLWKSVVPVIVRVSGSIVAASTGLVLLRSSQKLFIVTGLHLLECDAFIDHLGTWFLKEREYYFEKVFKRCSVPDSKGERKKEQTGSEGTPHIAPQITIEQFLPDDENRLHRTMEFAISKEICWHADDDLAIFGVEAPEATALEGTVSSKLILPTQYLDVMGFDSSGNSVVVPVEIATSR